MDLRLNQIAPRKLFITFLLTILTSLSFGQVDLPIEVLGKEGKVVSVPLVLSKEYANATRRLWIQVNNLSYQNKGSVSINDGTWVDLNHGNVDMHF